MTAVPPLPPEAQPDPGVIYHYDEAAVPAYTLPDALLTANGEKISGSQAWRELRRPELLHLFETRMYGRSPGRPTGMTFEVTSNEPHALNGLATRREVTISLTGNVEGPKMDLLLYLPNGSKVPCPAFLGLNFEGNHTVACDPGTRLTQSRCGSEDPAAGDSVSQQGQQTVSDSNPPRQSSRGQQAECWQVEKIVSRGYAVVTAHYGDLEPDSADGWKQGVRGFFSGGKEFQPDEWGAIAAWAWGLSRALDYLETDPDIDAGRVAVVGHSRLGKAALWAGAADERFAMAISNESGEGGAALSRRCIGETVARINGVFPHWFCGNFKEYNDRESAMPFDQHELVALIAPRPVYVASAQEDLWADPRGEFLGAKNAEPVYRLFGRPGLGVDDMPLANHSVGDFIGYHIRSGRHGVTEFDWLQFLAFADRHLAGL